MDDASTGGGDNGDDAVVAMAIRALAGTRQLDSNLRMNRKVPELPANDICRKEVLAGVGMKFSEKRCRGLTRLVVTTMIPATSFSGDASSCTLHRSLDPSGKLRRMSPFFYKPSMCHAQETRQSMTF